MESGVPPFVGRSPKGRGFEASACCFSVSCAGERDYTRKGAPLQKARSRRRQIRVEQANLRICSCLKFPVEE